MITEKNRPAATNMHYVIGEVAFYRWWSFEDFYGSKCVRWLKKNHPTIFLGIKIKIKTKQKPFQSRLTEKFHMHCFACYLIQSLDRFNSIQFNRLKFVVDGYFYIEMCFYLSMVCTSYYVRKNAVADCSWEANFFYLMFWLWLALWLKWVQLNYRKFGRQPPECGNWSICIF